MHTQYVYPILYEVNYGSLKSINCYLYKYEDQLILIDTGYNHPKFAAFFYEQLASYGFSVQHIDAIILTHHHEDHVGLVNEIYQLKQVPIYAHQLAIERLHFEPSYLTKKLQFFEQLYTRLQCIDEAAERLQTMRQTLATRDKKINAPIEPLVEGDSIFGLRVIEAPGHSPDSILLLNEQTGVLFSGDLLFKYGTSNALIDFDANMELLPTVTQQRNALLKLQQLDVTTVYPGHMQPFNDYQEVAQFYIDRIETKCARVVKAVEQGHSTILNIASALYGPKLTQQFSLVTSEVIGYVDYANRKGELIVHRDGTVALIRSI